MRSSYLNAPWAFCTDWLALQWIPPCTHCLILPHSLLLQTQEKSQFICLLSPRQQSTPLIVSTKTQIIISCRTWMFHVLYSECLTRTLMTASRSPTTQPSLDRIPQWASRSFLHSWRCYTVNQKAILYGRMTNCSSCLSSQPRPPNFAFIVLNNVRKSHSLRRIHTRRNNSLQMPSIFSSNQVFSHEGIWRLGGNHNHKDVHNPLPCCRPATEYVWATGVCAYPQHIQCFKHSQWQHWHQQQRNCYDNHPNCSSCCNR